MPIDNIRNFASAGINNDLIPVDLPGNFLTYAANIRAIDGGLKPFGGYTEIQSMPAGFNPYDIIYASSDNAMFWSIFGDDAIYKYENGVFTDVTVAGMPPLSNPKDWSSTMLSSIPVATHPGTGPVYYPPGSATFLDLPYSPGNTWADANQSCKIIVAHKQFLFGLGIVDNGADYPDAVRWSAPADIGGVPETWDHLDVTNVAGYTQLGGDGGSIIGALPMRDALVVYRKQGITIFDYIGGTFVWRIRNLNTSAGLLSQRSVVDVNGVHYFLSDGDIYKNDGNTVKSIAHDRIKKSLNSINKEHFDLSYAVHNQNKKEILFCVPSSGSGYPDIAYIYNYQYDSWLARAMPRTTDSGFGLTLSVSTAWDDSDSPWDGFGKSWADDSTTPFDYSVVSAMPAIDGEPAKLIAIDSLLGFNNEPFNSIIERTDYPIGGLDQATTITRIYPKIQGGTEVYIQVGSQQVPGGPVTWKKPMPYDPGKDRKIDVRTTGLLHAYRLYANNLITDFLVSGIDIEYTYAGRR